MDASPQKLTAQEADILAHDYAARFIEMLKQFNQEYPHPETGELLEPLDETALESFADSIFSILMPQLEPSHDEMRWMSQEMGGY